MKKHLLLLAAALFATFAQVQAAIEPTETQMWWGYFTDSDAASIDYDSGLGFGSASTFDAGIAVPMTDRFVSGSTINAVRIWFGPDVSKLSTDLTVWISTQQPTDIAAADYVQTVAKSSLTQGANDIALSTPFAVDGRDIFVGFTFSTRSAAYPLVSNGADAQNSFLFRHNGDQWYDFNGQGYGKLAIQLLLDGGDYPRDCAAATDFGRIVVLQGKHGSASFSFTNAGANPITSITYGLSTDDANVVEERTVTVSPVGFGGSKSITVDLGLAEQARKYTKQITIAKVNGNDNAEKRRTAYGDLIAVSSAPAVLPVVEEFTGTWCGYCPYGTVGMQAAHEAYGDRVALIAVHSGDVMQVSSYDDVVNAYASGFPSSQINRSGTSYYPYYLKSYLTKFFDRLTQGSLELNAVWTDEEKTAVEFRTTTRFFYDGDEELYGLAFVLVEDGLKGSGSRWAQTNYLSGQSVEADMAFWSKAGSTVSNLQYDHVAVAGWDVKDGVDGSVESSVRDGAVQEFVFTGDISASTLIQDKAKLTAIALLIDRKNGFIVNAARSEIADAATGVSRLEGERSAAVTGYYSIDGKRLAAPARGVNLVKFSDGRTEKVIRK